MAVFRQEADDELAQRYLGKMGSSLSRGGNRFGSRLMLVVLITAIAYVPAGSVGVLTLFGRVTGECCQKAPIWSIHSRETTQCQFARRS